MDFTSIPATYTDLCVKVSVRTNSTGAGNGFNISLNGSSSSFTRRVVYGTGSSALGASASDNAIGQVDGNTETASTFSSTDIYIPNYAGSTNKSMSSDTVMENNATQAYAVLTAALWSNTAAITSIALTPAVGSYVQYSTATLYGIKSS